MQLLEVEGMPVPLTDMGPTRITPRGHRCLLGFWLMYWKVRVPFLESGSTGMGVGRGSTGVWFECVELDSSMWRCQEGSRSFGS